MNLLGTKTDAQLKKWNKISLGIFIVIFFLMIVVGCITLFQISEGKESIWLPLTVPIILGPLAFIPILFYSAISMELKKRKKSDS